MIDLGKVAGKLSPTRRILVERQSVELCCPILQGLTATRRRAPIIVLQIQRFKERRHGNKKAPQIALGASGFLKPMTVWLQTIQAPDTTQPRDPSSGC